MSKKKALWNLRCFLLSNATQQFWSLKGPGNMRKLVLWSAFAAILAVPAFAGTWSGTLLDGNCYSQQKSAKSCGASSTTTAFALDVSGKIYNFDEAGNTKAAAALKNRADRSVEPNARETPVAATVTGTVEGNTLQVDTIQVQ
jgi:hypothetical protein